MAVAGIIIIVSAILFTNTVQKRPYCDRIQNPFTANTYFGESRAAKDEQLLEENTYVWSAAGLYSYAFAAEGNEVRLLNDDFMQHNLSEGDWTSGQVYLRNYYHSIGADNPMKELLYNDSWYYIGGAEESSIIEKYLQEHFNTDAVRLEAGKTMTGITIWKYAC